mgnify:CR=1 FL=1
MVPVCAISNSHKIEIKADTIYKLASYFNCKSKNKKDIIKAITMSGFKYYSNALLAPHIKINSWDDE